MDNEQEFEDMLTPEEIDVEIGKVEEFFRRIPDNLKAVAAIHLILEIVNQGSRDYFQAIGLFDEAKANFRDWASTIGAVNDEEDILNDAYESSKRFRCIEELKWGKACVVTPGEIYEIGFIGSDDRYSGGERYEVFLEEGKHFSICHDVFVKHFEEMDDVN